MHASACRQHRISCGCAHHGLFFVASTALWLLSCVGFHGAVAVIVTAGNAHHGAHHRQVPRERATEVQTVFDLAHFTHTLGANEEEYRTQRVDVAVVFASWSGCPQCLRQGVHFDLAWRSTQQCLSALPLEGAQVVLKPFLLNCSDVPRVCGQLGLHPFSNATPSIAEQMAAAPTLLLLNPMHRRMYQKRVSSAWKAPQMEAWTLASIFGPTTLVAEAAAAEETLNVSAFCPNLAKYVVASSVEQVYGNSNNCGHPSACVNLDDLHVLSIELAIPILTSIPSPHSGNLTARVPRATGIRDGCIRSLVLHSGTGAERKRASFAFCARQSSATKATRTLIKSAVQNFLNLKHLRRGRELPVTGEQMSFSAFQREMQNALPQPQLQWQAVDQSTKPATENEIGFILSEWNSAADTWTTTMFGSSSRPFVEHRECSPKLYWFLENAEARLLDEEFYFQTQYLAQRFAALHKVPLAVVDVPGRTLINNASDPILERIEKIWSPDAVQWLQGDRSSTPRCGVRCSMENASSWVLSPRCPQRLETRDIQSGTRSGSEPLSLLSFLDLCRRQGAVVSNAKTKPMQGPYDSVQPQTHMPMPLPLLVASGIELYTGEASSLSLQLHQAQRMLFLMSRSRIATPAGAINLKARTLHAILSSSAISAAVANKLLRVIAVPRSSATIHIFEYLDAFEAGTLNTPIADNVEEGNAASGGNASQEFLLTFQARVVLRCNDEIDVLQPDTISSIERVVTGECNIEK